MTVVSGNRLFDGREIDEVYNPPVGGRVCHLRCGGLR